MKEDRRMHYQPLDKLMSHTIFEDFHQTTKALNTFRTEEENVL